MQDIHTDRYKEAFVVHLVKMENRSFAHGRDQTFDHGKTELRIGTIFNWPPEI